MNKIFFSSLIMFFLLLPGVVSAATLSFQPSEIELYGNDIKPVDVMLRSDGRKVNAISGTVVLPESCLDIVEVSTGKSLVDIWLELPKKVVGSLELPFTGIIVGGMEVEQGLLFTLYLRCQSESGSESMSLQLQNVLLIAEDGQLTNEGAQTELMQVNYSVANADYEPLLPREQDHIAPTQFTIQRVTSSLLNEGNPSIVFATNDDYSGIQGYELLVSSVKLPINDALLRRADWVPVASPHRLNLGEEEKYLYVKASDKAGNIVVEESEPTLADLEQKHQKQLLLLVLLVAFAVVFSLAERYIFRKYRFID